MLARFTRGSFAAHASVFQSVNHFHMRVLPRSLAPAAGKPAWEEPVLTRLFQLIQWPWFAPLVTVSLLILNVIMGYIFIPDSATTPEQYRDMGGALALPLISGFCLFFLPVLGRKAQASILKAAELSGSSMRHARVYARHIERAPLRNLRLALLVGTTIAIAYLATAGLLYIDSIDTTANLKRIPLLLQSIYFWVAIILLLSSLSRITVLLTRFATNDLRIELFHIEELVPLANTVLWNTVSISAGLALTPILWLGREVPKLDIPLVMGVMAVTLYLLFFPIVKVRQAVLERKQLALERIRDALKSATRSDDQKRRRLTDSVKRLEEINNLVGVREEISRTREWPITVPVGIRVALIVLVPPISWIGASLIDWLVQQVVA
jgi:hypothetical protein